MFEIWLLIFRGFWRLSVMVRRGITCEILGARCFLTKNSPLYKSDIEMS